MSLLNKDALEIPSPAFTERTATLSKRVAAVRLIQKQDGRCKLGGIAQLSPGPVDLCGPGYNERTVKVRFNGQCYFVFKDDLN
jgi:hypothetical protein